VSAAPVKALRTLVKVRKRQGERLEADVQAARRQLAELEEARRAAEGELAACRADEAAARDERDALQNGAFTPHAMRALDFRIDDLKGATAQAEKALADSHKHVERQAAVVKTAQAAVRRNDQRIEGFEQRIATILRERDAAIEELAEEETEETGAARFVARQRAQRQEAAHG
jgi:predicted  nucleic acid-binding Zn-ribbon protein